MYISIYIYIYIYIFIFTYIYYIHDNFPTKEKPFRIINVHPRESSSKAPIQIQPYSEIQRQDNYREYIFGK